MYKGKIGRVECNSYAARLATSWQHGSHLRGMLCDAVHRQLNLCIWLCFLVLLARRICDTLQFYRSCFALYHFEELSQSS